MEIRQWGKNDLEQINNLLLELASTIGFEYHNDLNILAMQFDTIQNNPGFYKAFVGIEGNKIIGFISLVFYTSVLHKKGTALINELMVDSAYQNMGVGKQLLNHCINLAEKEGWDELEVGAEKSNTKAIDFYKRNGLNEEHVLLGKEFD